MQLKAQIVSETLEHVRLIYVSRQTVKWWNDRKEEDDIDACVGWYWVSAEAEAGPFMSRSAAIRDAYYKFVLKRPATPVGRRALPPLRLVGPPRMRELGSG